MKLSADESAVLRHRWSPGMRSTLAVLAIVLLARRSSPLGAHSCGPLEARTLPARHRPDAYSRVVAAVRRR